MDQLIKMIEVQIQAEPFMKKIVLVPSMGSGRQLMLAIARTGIPCMNLTCETVHSLAESLSKRLLFERGLQVVEADTGRYIVLDILRQIKESGGFSYFQDIELTPGIHRAIYKSIMELRMSGQSSATLNVNDFICSEKGIDILEILTRYERVLIETNKVDTAALLTMAAACIPTLPDCVLFLPDNVELTVLEKQFLERYPAQKISARMAQIIGIEDSFGNDCDDLNQFSWLFAVDELPHHIIEPSICIVQAQGESCETREILRRIVCKGWLLDQCSIFYSTKEPYSQLYYDLSKSLQIPMTFGEGVSIGNTYPGRLLSSLLH